LDADTVLTLDFVTGVDNRGDGTLGIRYRVTPGGPYPTPYPKDRAEMVAQLDDAIGVSADEWATLEAADIAERIGAQWVNHLPAPPAPPDSWTDGITAAGSPILTSQSGGWSAEAWPAKTPVTETDGQGAIPLGTTVLEILDAAHVRMSAPAAADAQGIAFTFAPTEEAALHAELAQIETELAGRGRKSRRAS
jgi:hypothetical protein